VRLYKHKHHAKDVVLKPHGASRVHKSSKRASYPPHLHLIALNLALSITLVCLFIPFTVDGRTYSFERPITSTTNMSDHSVSTTSNLSLDPGLFLLRQFSQGAPFVFDKVRRDSRPPSNKHEPTYIFIVRHIQYSRSPSIYTVHSSSGGP
jgi:hypothetical protein